MYKILLIMISCVVLGSCMSILNREVGEDFEFEPIPMEEEATTSDISWDN